MTPDEEARRRRALAIAKARARASTAPRTDDLPEAGPEALDAVPAPPRLSQGPSIAPSAMEGEADLGLPAVSVSKLTHQPTVTGPSSAKTDTPSGGPSPGPQALMELVSRPFDIAGTLGAETIAGVDKWLGRIAQGGTLAEANEGYMESFRRLPGLTTKYTGSSAEAHPLSGREELVSGAIQALPLEEIPLGVVTALRGLRTARALEAADRALIDRLLKVAEETPSADAIRASMNADDMERMKGLLGLRKEPKSIIKPGEAPKVAPSIIDPNAPNAPVVRGPSEHLPARLGRTERQVIEDAKVANAPLGDTVYLSTPEGFTRKAEIVAQRPDGKVNVLVDGKIEYGVPHKNARTTLMPATLEKAAEASPRAADAVDAGAIATGAAEAVQKSAATRILGAPRAALDALDGFVSRNLTDPLMRKSWGLVPEKVRNALAEGLKTGPERASMELAGMLRGFHEDARASRIFATAGGRRLAVAQEAAGVMKGSVQERDLYRYIGGEIDWSPNLPTTLKGTADEMVKTITDELRTAVDLKVASPENLKEHLRGLLQRSYNDTLAEYGFKPSKGVPKVDELIARNDAWGFAADATKEEVEAAIRSVDPRVDLGALTYIREQDGSTLVKFGTDERARTLAEAVEARFPKGAIRDKIRVIPMEERLQMREKMNPAEAFSRTYANMRTRNAAARMQKSVADAFAIDAPKGIDPGKSFATADGKAYKVLPSDAKWGPLAGRAVPESMYAEVARVAETTDGFADFIEGGISSIKGDLIGNTVTAAANMTTNAAYSLLGGISIMDPHHYNKWGQAMADIYQFRKSGVISPRLKAAIDAGVNIEGIASGLLDDEMAALAQTFGERMSWRNAGKLAMQVVTASPNLEVKGLSKAQNMGAMALNQAGHGALYGGMVGGPAGAAVGAVTGAAAAPLNRALAKFGRLAFDVGDPTYQLALFYKNMDEFGGDAVKAMAETRDWTQSFSVDDMPALANTLMGRRAGATGAERVAGRLGGPLFAGYPVNWVRIAAKGAQKKPVSTAAALGSGYIFADHLRSKMVAEGRIDQATADKLAEEQPLTLVVPEGERDVRTVPVGRYLPSMESVTDMLQGFPFIGIGAQLPIKLFAAETPEGRLPDRFGGFPVVQDRERQAPDAAQLRAVNELGGAYSARGRLRQLVESKVRHEKDLFGKEPTWPEVMLKAFLGVNTSPFSGPELGTRVGIGERMDEKRERTTLRKMLRSGRVTDEEKERARETYDERMDR